MDFTLSCQPKLFVADLTLNVQYVIDSPLLKIHLDFVREKQPYFNMCVYNSGIVTVQCVA